MTDTSNLGLPCIDAAQAQKHVTDNEALRILDSLVQLAVLDRDLNAPPGSPNEGERWIVKASPAPTGDWAGHGDQIAAWQDGGWQFSTPQLGWIAYAVDEGALLTWNGTAWDDFFSTVTAIQNLALLGVGTTADATNPFSAKLNNALWVAKTVAEGGDGDLRYKLSKEGASKTLSFLFQDNFSGRAEIGLTGDDDFHFKTSPDGSSWVDALVLDKATGAARLNSALQFTGDLSPAQITADQNDYDPAGLSAASVLRLTADAPRRITGLAGGADGRLLSIVNGGSNPLVLANANASSSAVNRFDIAADLLIAPSEGAILIYDTTSSRWRLLSPRANTRERLIANRTYYVRTDGSDSNAGLANNAGGAFLTIQKAYDTIVSLDLGGYTVTIQIADGTYSAGLSIASPWTGGGRVTVQGNASTPANVLVNCAASSCIRVDATLPGLLTVKDMKLISPGGGSTGIDHQGIGTIAYSNIDFGACASWHIAAGKPGAFIDCIGNYSISGNAAGHMLAAYGGQIRCTGRTITLAGTPAFALGFVYVTRGGLLDAEVDTFSGAATGSRYSIDSGGIVYTGGGGASYFPGSSSGSGGTTSGGGYYQ